MESVNCLFNYDGINYRLNIPTTKEKEVVTFDELKKNLRDHPKLKELDFFDTEKYVVEIFDKGFEDYVKMPRGIDICDYSKLRARLRPKSTLILTKKKEEESRKRPFSMYAEINIEEEHASKVLRGSPPPSSQRSQNRQRQSSPSNFHRLRLGHESSRTENQSRSSHSSNSRTPNTSRPANTPASSSKPKSTQPKPSSTPKPTPQTTPKHVSTESSIAPRESNSPPNPFAMSGTPRTPANLNVSRPSTSSGATIGIMPRGVDKDGYLLAKAVNKYDDEFTNIMMFDDIWQTDAVWTFVYRLISSQGVTSVTNVRETREAFKKLVDKYIELLKKTELTEAAANAQWTLFDIFHTKMNLKPFYGRIQTLREAFNEEKGNEEAEVTEVTEVTEEAPKEPEDPDNEPFDPLASPNEAQRAAIAAFVMDPNVSPMYEPPPGFYPDDKLQDDIILLSNDEPEKPVEDDEDEVQEVNPSGEPTVRRPSPQSTEPAAPIVITSDDFRLLLAVEDHNQAFFDTKTPEYNIWRDVADQVNLYQPFDVSLILKYKTRFYELLREFQRIINSSMPDSEKARWKLYSTFVNIRCEPFLARL